VTILSVQATPISDDETTRRCTIFLTIRSRRNFPFRVVWSLTPEARCLRIAVARSRALPGATDLETPPARKTRPGATGDDQKARVISE
jgi:hypothetical protein